MAEEYPCEICDGTVTAVKYGGGVCSGCGREYRYDEGVKVVLTDTDKELLKA